MTVLRAAAREASARGAAEAATRYLRRALDEPPPEGQHGVVLHELGLAEATDRRRDRFEPHLRGAMAVTSEPLARAEIALHLGRSLAACGEFRGSIDVLDAALRSLEAPESEVAVALEAELMGMAFYDFTATEIAAPR